MAETDVYEMAPFRALYTYKAKPGCVDALQEVLMEAAEAVRNDPGMIGLTLARSIIHSEGFIIFSRWEDRVTLMECFHRHSDTGLVKRISDQCEHYSLDVLAADDPEGALAPAPGRGGGVIASRLAMPLPEYRAEAKTLMEKRSAVALAAPGCVWVQGNVHADRDDYLYLATGWESRAALEATLEEYPLPAEWSDVGTRTRAASLDMLEPLLEIAPDRLSAPADAQAHR